MKKKLKNHEKSWKILKKNAYSVLECSKKRWKIVEKILEKCWKKVEKILKNHEKSWKIMKNLEKNVEKVLKIC